MSMRGAPRLGEVGLRVVDMDKVRTHDGERIGFVETLLNVLT